MTGLRKTVLIILAALPAVLGTAGFARAFHDGGVAQCDGCHTMHNSSAGQGVTQNPSAAGQSNPKLLLSSSSSAVCLICHEGTVPAGYRIATSTSSLPPGVPPAAMTPGGDFAWLKKSYSWLEGTTLRNEQGDRHGHNIVAAEFGYLADATKTSAPGGSYPSADLHCTSCHDPHGRYRVRSDGVVATTGVPISDSGSHSMNGTPVNPDAGSSVGTYRLLAGSGYQPPGMGQAFVYGPPAAMAPQDYNRSEAATQTRVAYGAGTSRWCANCHTGFHTDSTSTFQHSVEVTLGATIADYYNAYVKTGDLTGNSTTSFLSLVPFETALSNSPSDRNALAAMARSDNGNLSGPSDQNTVGCLTCHRAHASGWRNMLRWNPDSTLLTVNGSYPGLDNGAPAQHHMGRTEAETRRAYYDRPASFFGTNQNRLCEKCHSE